MKNIIYSPFRNGHLLTIGACMQQRHPSYLHDEQYFLTEGRVDDLKILANRKGFSHVFGYAHQEVIKKPSA